MATWAARISVSSAWIRKPESASRPGRHARLGDERGRPGAAEPRRPQGDVPRQRGPRRPALAGEGPPGLRRFRRRGHDIALGQRRLGQSQPGLGQVGRPAVPDQRGDRRLGPGPRLRNEPGTEQGHTPRLDRSGVVEPMGFQVRVGLVEGGERGRNVASQHVDERMASTRPGHHPVLPEIPAELLRGAQVGLGRGQVAELEVGEGAVVTQDRQPRAVAGPPEDGLGPAVSVERLLELAQVVQDRGPLDLESGQLDTVQREPGPISLTQRRARLPEDRQRAGQAHPGLRRAHEQPGALGDIDGPPEVTGRAGDVASFACREAEGPLRHRCGPPVAALLGQVEGGLGERSRSPRVGSNESQRLGREIFGLPWSRGTQWLRAWHEKGPPLSSHPWHAGRAYGLMAGRDDDYGGLRQGGSGSDSGQSHLRRISHP